MGKFWVLNARVGDLSRRDACSGLCAVAIFIVLILLWACGLTLCLGLAGGPAMAAASTRWAQADIVFQHLTTANGLPQGTATALVEDRNGFLWVGTQGGLARWDGQRFHVYRSQTGDPYSLPDSFVNALYLDSAGNLWVGTNDGLARYLPDQDRFQIFSAGVGGLSHVTVNAITGDGKGGIWVGTEGGLDHIDAQQRVTAAPKWRNRLPDLRVRSLIRSKDGALWVGARKGLMRVAANGETRTIQFPSAVKTMPGALVLYQASDGKIWVGSRDQGAFWIDAKLKVHAVILPKEAAVDSVLAMLEVRPGVLWLGSTNQGIVAVDANGEFLRQIRNDVRVMASLADDDIWCMLRDRSGLVWVGTGLGLSRHVQQQAVLTLFGVQGRTDGLPDSDILALASASDGRVWFSMGNNGLAVYNPDSGRIEPVGLGWSTPPILATGPQGAVYIAVNNAMYRSTGKGNELKPMILPVPQTQLPSYSLAGPQGSFLPRENLFEGVNVLLVEERVIWVGGANGLWRLILDADGEIIDWYSEASGQFTDQRITALQRAVDGKLWVGTENGLNLLNPETHTVEQILPNRADVNALGAASVSSLLIDRKKRLWVTTFGGGISLLERRNGDGRFQFRRFGLEQGLPSMIVIKLQQDANGTIWGSTEEGLISIDVDSLRIRAFRRGDGVAINSYWVYSGTVTKKGEMLFGGSGGMTVVIPQLVKNTTQYQAPVVVTDARIGGKPFSIGLLNTKNPSVLTLMPDANSLALEFAALDYAAPERNRYAYRLFGYDSKWIETDASRRLASYANLPPGKYRLELLGSNRDGMFSTQTKALMVWVLPAWYQTWWWRTLFVLASLMLIAGLIQARTSYLRKRQFELKSQVRFRTSELRQKQSELVNANAELAQTADTLRLMGDVGRDITANLEQIQVFEALYHHVGGLLDVVGMTIYRINLEKETLDCCFAREYGEDMPLPMIPLDSPTSSAARAVRERREVLLALEEDTLVDDMSAQLSAQLSAQVPAQVQDQVPARPKMLSAFFVPLIVGQRVLGAMSVQSSRVHAYGERERLIFRTVCAYGAIALSNTEALDALHEAQRQLLQQEKMASLGGLVSGVAHEVNTPLGNTLVAISGVMDILRNQQKALRDSRLSLVQLEEYTTDGLAYAELAQQTSLRVAEMMSSFKAIATHSGVDQRHEVNLALYMPDVVSLVRSSLERIGCQIVIEVESNLILRIVPEALTEALARIFSNLMHHAFVDRENGEVSGVVRVTARRDFDGDVLIEVTDNGCGISDHDMPKVFDPFFTTKSGIGGHVGLGLHIAYNHITQRLNGIVTVASVAGQGMTVTIRLPQSCCV